MTKEVKSNGSNGYFSLALLGKKIGMTQIFNDEGEVVPVTALKVGPCVVLQKKTKEKDGYNAVQLGFDDKKKQRVIKAEAGHAEKAKTPVKRFIKEVRLSDEQINEYEVGQTIGAGILRIGDSVDVTGTSIGKGFAGVMKRWNFAGKPATHGTHEFFRHGGSIGNRSEPGKVFKGKKMPGHMGNEKVTNINLSVVGVDNDTDIVLLRGSVPGAKNSYVTVKASTRGKFEPRSVKEAKEAPTETPAAESSEEQN
jgi:large subunit ribosomal protein L3